jgi:hypothetical protein
MAARRSVSLRASAWRVNTHLPTYLATPCLAPDNAPDNAPVASLSPSSSLCSKLGLFALEAACTRPLGYVQYGQYICTVGSMHCCKSDHAGLSWAMQTRLAQGSSAPTGNATCLALLVLLLLWGLGMQIRGALPRSTSLHCMPWPSPPIP